MKNLLVTLFLFPLKMVFAQSGIDVLHYQFHIGLNDDNDTLYGVAIVNFTTTEKTDSFSLDFNTKLNDGKGMQVTSISFIDPRLKKNLPSFDNNKITFKKTDFKTGDTTALIINYKGIPSDGLIISKNKYGHRTFFADNWPNRAHYWLPCKDDPADKASAEFIVTAPGHYQVVANGIQIEETSLNNGFKKTHWKEDVPLPTKVMTLGVADFAVRLAGMVNECIPVTCWIYPENRENGFSDFGIAQDILPWFINYIGPYGYKKLANVQSKTKFGGLENANTIFYSENKVTGDRSCEPTVVHEIAHQWFGNMVSEKSFAHLWLSEGFATYFTTLYFEKTIGAGKAKELRDEDRQQVIASSKTDKTPVVNTTETNYMNLLNTNNYQKGGWILHMLRMQLGDSVFKKIIRKYYSTYAGRNADSEDFKKIAEEVSGKNLGMFFKQWLYTTGQPRLDVKWKYNLKEKSILVTVKQLQVLPYSFPLEIAYGDGKPSAIKKTVAISKKEEFFKIPVIQKPVKLDLDPDINLLFEGNISELK